MDETKPGPGGTPLVSIGVPVYNGEEYLEECLESILNQTYENWECVIINNKCSDSSPAIAASFVKRDHRFKVFDTSELLPITTNWNFCFSMVSEEAAYFKILPADDWIFPEFIERMVQLMESHSEIGICASFRLVDSHLRAGGLDIYRGSLFDGREVLVHQLQGDYDVTSSVNAVLYRIDSLRKLTHYPEIFVDEAYHIDTFLSYELLTLSDLGFIHKVLSYTRRHANTVTSNVSNRFGTAFFFREYVLHHFLNQFPEIEKTYRRHRIAYAYELFRARIRLRKSVTEWHRNRLKRPIRTGEYLKAVFRRMRGKRF